MKGLSFFIKQGEFVAIVGTSGSGKSTVVKLMERFYEISDGSILIDKIDIRKLNIKYLRSNIGLVS